MHENYTLYIGCLKSTGEYLGPARVKDTITEVLAEDNISGATMLDATGLWQGDTEPTVVLKLCGVSEKLAVTLAKVLCYRLQQDAVMVERSPPVAFVTINTTTPNFK